MIERRNSNPHRFRGVALVMVLLVLTALAIIGAPFVLSMVLQEKSSLNFEAAVKVRKAAEGARNHAMAQLEGTVRSVEGENEAEKAGVDEAPRADKGGRFSMSSEGRRIPRRRGDAQRRGRVVREDLGEKAKDRNKERHSGSEGSGVPGLMESKQGPPGKDSDDAGELSVSMPESVQFPLQAPTLISGIDTLARPAGGAGDPRTAVGGIVVSFNDAQGITATVEAFDEQGKININSATPNLLANLFGMSVLDRPLHPNDTEISLEDANPFRDDGSSQTIDGAVVVIRPQTGRPEAITYKERKGNVLQGCFRGAFFSIPSQGPFPTGSLVYDLRGWKAGFHKLRAEAQGGFAASQLSEFPSIEALREVSNWQVASLFLSRLRGEGLTAEFLQKNGIRPSKLEELGLDPSLFESDSASGAKMDAGAKRDLDNARRTLRRLNVPRSLSDSFEKAYGYKAVIALAARFEHMTAKDAQVQVKALEERIKKTPRQQPKFDRLYLEACLQNLAEVYRSPGIETILPEDLESLRDSITVSSSVPAKWSEPQVNEDAILVGEAGGEIIRLARPGENGGSGLVRIRSRQNPSQVEYNMVAHREQGGAVFGFYLLFPVQSSYGDKEAWVDFLECHPVNVNTASFRAIKAVLTGVSGAALGKLRPKDEKDQKEGGKEKGTSAGGGAAGDISASLKTPGVVTPGEAASVARRIIDARPLRGYQDLFQVLVGAAQASEIEEEDVYPIYINSIQPNHNKLRVSTTGFCFASGDVYTIESRAGLRGEMGGEMGRLSMREIVEVSPPGYLRWMLFTQSDFTSELFFNSPYSQRYPEDHYLHSVSLPGSLGHLVRTTPVIYKTLFSYQERGQDAVAHFAVPGGERGTLRLETPEAWRGKYLFGSIESFRNTADGLELRHGESYPVPGFDLGTGRGGGAGGGGGGILDLTNVPASIEAWMRFRTYPQEFNRDGMLILMDAGVEEERNRISLLFDQKSSQWVARIYDSSMPDPSIERGKQYFEIRAQRPFDLHTWYHVRLAWDGAYPGGIRLFIDGIPVGRSNYTAELSGALSAQSGALPIQGLMDFPKSGVLRINHELVEYEGGHIRSLQPSYFERWLATQTGPGQTAQGSTLSQPGTGAAKIPQGGLQESLQRGAGLNDPGNNRASVRPATHPAGSPAYLHGYSILVDRNYEESNQQSNYLYGPGGLRLAEDLLPSRFPDDIVAIYNCNPPPPLLSGPGRDADKDALAAGRAASQEYLAPAFLRTIQRVNVQVQIVEWTPAFDWGNESYQAHEFFQSRGIVHVRGLDYYYVKEPLPPTHPAVALLKKNAPAGNKADSGSAKNGAEDQLMGLRIICRYPDQVGLAQLDPKTRTITFENGNHLELRSVLANQPIGQFYPPAGILEVRGVRPLWRRTPAEPDLYQTAGSVFDQHPDDMVEWVRYHDVGTGQIDPRLFIGRSNRCRDYPRSYNHMFHRGAFSVAGDKFSRGGDRSGEPLRLVLELAGGGAGYGDYVTLSTDDPNKYEPEIHRVYRAMERDDGRFWVSLYNQNALEYKPFKYQYAKGENARLVKFPSRALPQVGSGRMVFFGDAIRGSSSQPLPGGADSREAGEELTDGVILDEVKKVYNQIQGGAAAILLEKKHVLVPLENGTVRREPIQTPLGQGEVITGTIPRDRVVSRENPLEILVVSAGRGNFQFAPNLKRGVLALGDEYFYFENPRALQNTGSAAQGGGGASKAIAHATLTDVEPPDIDSNNTGLDSRFAQIDSRFVGMRNPYARMILRDLKVSAASGDFEKEGFARIENIHLNNGFEIFYYRSFAGGGFSKCLRGQFHTGFSQPLRVVVQTPNGAASLTFKFSHPVQDCTTRLRLIGRGLLGTERKTHGFGDPVSLVSSVEATELTGPMTDLNIMAADTQGFPGTGYLLIDSTLVNRPFEIVAYTGIQGENIFLRPHDDDGRGILRSSFGSVQQPIDSGMFAFAMPFRHFDRYQPETESENLAYLQKSYRIPGATWRSISWRERKPPTGVERLNDIVIAARCDGTPDWSEKPSNHKGGLFFFEAPEASTRGEDPRFDINVTADQLDVRVYFRYKRGCFMRVREDYYRDDWKETPILELLTVEYEKAGRILRHEETSF